MKQEDEEKSKMYDISNHPPTPAEVPYDVSNRPLRRYGVSNRPLLSQVAIWHLKSLSESGSYCMFPPGLYVQEKKLLL